MDMHTDSSLEFEDDDVFYTDLQRQVLLLTADDDEEFLEKKTDNSRNAIKQGYKRSMAGFPTNYSNWEMNENSGLPPAWLSNLWRNSNGTGVFIPHIVKSRRKQKTGRMNTAGGRKYKQMEKM
ncbi:hypothetical protein L1049_005899 [Liquidambar formosana]|uniref:Uncharacterized protein n=1 Tax=Liquidambar formosana TaxID=63359 RepID=A0AAP0REK1_LIQFO